MYTQFPDAIFSLSLNEVLNCPMRTSNGETKKNIRFRLRANRRRSLMLKPNLRFTGTKLP